METCTLKKRSRKEENTLVADTQRHLIVEQTECLNAKMLFTVKIVLY